MDYTYPQIAKMIDHSLLNPILTDSELEAGCRLARDYDVASVCIKPYFLKRCSELLSGSSVASSTVIGFPHGSHATAVKLAEAEQALRDGGTELDMVVNIGKVLSEDWAYLRQDIGAVLEAAHQADAIVKVIFENCFLQDKHKIRLCELCAELGADFAKTSTGYGTGGASIQDLQLMRAHLPASVQVKAAGGVRTFNELLAIRALGVARVGASQTAKILDDCRIQIERED